MGIEQLAINTIRTLSMDAVQAANSGHPGTPMALAPVGYWLFQHELRYDPADPHWPARDRFVLSCGHASMLLYSLLHLSGVRQVDSSDKVLDQPAVSLDDIRNFRQLDSRCPGHPEHGHTTGVETTTGPLGQGIGNSVGMAIAARMAAAHFNRPDFELFGWNVYALCSDGDMMEGVGGEAASLAGHLRLSNLCWTYDNNHITIDGPTKLAYSDDVARRFEGYGWRVAHVADANDLRAIERAYQVFHDTHDRPTLVIVRSHIGYGAPNKQDTSEAHGAPLGEEEVRLAKANYGWPQDAKFLVPPEVVAHFQQGIGARGKRLREEWQAKFASYSKQFADRADAWRQMLKGDVPEGWDRDLPEFKADAKGVASRVSSGKVIDAIGKKVPWLVGGAADLASSTRTTLTFPEAGDFQPDSPGGRNLHFGVREHGMAAVLNGLALCKARPYGSTFLVFSDYARGSKRLSAIMGLPVIYIYTHDSIGVGEDGPTHQPIEHLAALRAIPNMVVIRPGDANEVLAAWRVIMRTKDRPISLILTRQDLPTLDRTRFSDASGAERGAYILADAPNGRPQLILIATGSEVAATVEAHEQLIKDGIQARVVSMPSWELFDEQDEAYRRSVLPPEVTARLAVEMAAEQGWSRYLGRGGRFIGMHGYGASAPFKVLVKHFGFTAERIAAEAREMIAASDRRSRG